MLTASPELINTLQRDDAVRAKARVFAEWNHNRYTKIATVDNFGYPEKDNGYDLEVFPIESITEPLRPTAGIAFAKAGEAKTSSGYSSIPTNKRFYTTSPDAKYKHWTSPGQSSTVAPTYSIANAKPHVIYDTLAWTNKIYLCFENSWATPVAYTVQTTTNGTTWTTVASNVAVGADGVVELYLQGNGSWSTNPFYTNAVQIKGIKVEVSRMSVGGSYLNVVEMGARLVSDLTDYLVSYDITNEIADADFITPMGIASSNTGSVTLSNYDGRFNNDNPDSLYYGLIDANVKFTIDLGIDTTPQGGPGYEWVRQATMFADTWNVDMENAEVSLKDASKYLQEIFPLPMLIENVSIGKAIWRMLDSIGFNSYAYSQTAESPESLISYFWTDGEKSVWEVIQTLCKATQSACYFDERGVLQIKTRDAAFNKNQPAAWTLDGTTRGVKKPDIVELSVGNSYEANKVTINYKPTSLAEDTQKRPISEIVWEPEGDVVLRSSALRYDMTATTTVMSIDPKDAAYWPYEGMANVRGEIVRFSGKAYRYVNKTGSYSYVTIKSNDEKLNIDNNLTADGQQWRNAFTGSLRLTERGVGPTTAVAHDSTIAGWAGNYGTHATTMRSWAGGLKHVPEDGIMRLQTNKNFTGNHWYVASRANNAYAEPNYFFGTRMKFPSTPAGTSRAAGLWFHGSADLRSMYVIDVMTTKAVSPFRSYRNEISVIRREPGKNTYLGKGAVYAIGDNQWFDLEVQANGPIISVSINGRTVLNATDPATDLPATSRQGVFARGYTVADFEHYYFSAYSPGSENDLDNSSLLDLRRGGYYSSQFYRDYMYYVRTAKRKVGRKTVTYKQAYRQRLFDEFGMQVHEVREYDVKFEKPTVYSSLYVSNQDQCVIPEYIGSAFGAKFIVANAARQNAVINGDDTTLGADNSVSQKMMITARTVQQREVKNHEVKDEQAIRARGEIPLVFESDWIQSEASAKALGEWIINNWSKPSDEVEVEVFGNPLFQLGDLVAINYEPQDMTSATHKYFVTNVSQSWSDGPVTTMVLRRAHI